MARCSRSSATLPRVSPSPPQRRRLRRAWRAEQIFRSLRTEHAQGRGPRRRARGHELRGRRPRVCARNPARARAAAPLAAPLQAHRSSWCSTATPSATWSSSNRRWRNPSAAPCSACSTRPSRAWAGASCASGFCIRCLTWSAIRARLNAVEELRRTRGTAPGPARGSAGRVRSGAPHGATHGAIRQRPRS